MVASNSATQLIDTLPVANGGTGVTTSTGTGSVVLTGGPTIINPTISGGLYPGTVTFSVGSTFGGGSVEISTPSQSTNTILNLPVVTTTPDTLATLAATQTLTNKTISGASNTLSNVSLTTAVTGTLPVANGGTGLNSAGAAGQFLATTGSALSYRYTQAQGLGFGGAGVNVAETVPRWSLTSSYTNATGTLRVVAVYLYAGQVVNNITFATYTTAGASVTGTWGGLFTLSGSTTTLVAATAQQGLTSLAASTYFTWPIAQIAAGASTSYTVPTTGIYYVGVCITATTPPTISGAVAMTANTSAVPLLSLLITGSLNPPTIGTTSSASSSAQMAYYALT